MQARTLSSGKSNTSFFGKDGAMRLLVHCSLLSMLSMPIIGNQANASIADSPLYLTSAAEPNIMFVLDDSGSMQWDVMPDPSPVLTSVYFTFPRPQTLYARNYGYSTLAGPAGNYNGVARFDPADRYARFFRTAQFNPIYYNPAIRYDPWRNDDGSLRAVFAPTAAPYNPMTVAEGTLNLEADQTSTAVWLDDNGSRTAGSVTYYPATYFNYTGSNVLTGPTDANNIQADFTRVEIKPANAPFPKAVTRTDCAAATCSYDEEIRNFTNWFSYYRSRVLAARAGIGNAFSQQGNNMRVGFGAINKTSENIDGVATRTIVRGVRPFSGGDRSAFFNSLYTHAMPSVGTPLRRALGDVGQYYSRTDNRGPWGNTPGTDDGVVISSHAQCRQSYAILMTDGYWNDDPASLAAAQLNVDGTGGPLNTGPGGASFNYTAVSPFSDGHSNTLADVAMYYWKNDLRIDLDNAVPTSTINPAFWQHMSTFGVGLGVTGTVNPANAFSAISSGDTISWSDPSGTDAAKLDDLLHASVNGRGGFFSASDPTTFATELSNVLTTITGRVSSAAAVASNSTRLSSSTHLYQALFNSSDWTGNLKAFPLTATGAVGAEAWDAANGIPAHGLRNIRTWNGTAGADFSGTVGALTSNEVDYLRGDETNEVRNGGTFRNRNSRLGDIVNADPHFVQNENFGYNVLGDTSGSEYPAFLTNKGTRTAVVYAAANDGMLHAFRASDGVERFAYVPSAGWTGAPPKLRQLTSPSYAHKYFVDGSPTSWDAYWGGSWKTVLTGGLGAGGKGVYALDVSNPDSFGTANVLWEFNGGVTPNDMGHVMGNVTVARFRDGNFWAVFGNGYESVSGRAVLFMVQIGSPATVKRIVLDNVTGGNNGLSTPILVDEGGDRIVDLIYAGDLKGNLWKVDVTGAVSTWGSAYTSGATPVPLFQAKDASGNPQPITATPEVGRAPSGTSGLMVYVGTGKYFENGDNTTTTVQTMYGVVDSGSRLIAANHRSLLQQQVINFEATVLGNRVRAVSDGPVDYATQKGWYIDLVSPPTPPGTQRGERVVSPARLFGGRLIFQSIIPSVSPCDFGGASWLMVVNPETGGLPQVVSFDLNGDRLFNSGDQVDIGGGVMVNVSGLDSGVGLSGGFGVPITAGDVAFVPLSGTTGKLGATAISSGVANPRSSWRQIQ